jgi:hypothetical protein
MRHPDPRPGICIAVAGPDRGGSPRPRPGLRGLLMRLLQAAWPERRGQADALEAGYALRRRQEANRQRLACPACRPPGSGRPRPIVGAIGRGPLERTHGSL